MHAICPVNEQMRMCGLDDYFTIRLASTVVRTPCYARATLIIDPARFCVIK